MEPSAPTAAANLPAEPARFAIAVTAARTQRQMSRQALAEQAGISLKVLEDLERGYPVPSEIAAAVCRNLNLPPPSLELSPLVRFALRLRERRGLARLSRAQLARKVGVNTPIIRSLETATMRPSQEVCIGLLGVEALELQESDVAAFLLPAVPGADGEAIPNSQFSAEDSTIPRPSLRTAKPADGPASRPPEPRRTQSVCQERMAGNPVVASFRVRVHANGKVCVEMPPPTIRLHRGVVSE